MPNIKISDLNKANRISDNALIAIVQENANKVITVKELGEKISENTNRLIAKLKDEIDKTSQGGNVIKLKNIVARHEYILQNQKRSIDVLSHKIGDLSRNTHANTAELKRFHGVVRKCENDNILTRRGLAYTNTRVDKAVQDIYTVDQKTTYLGEQIDRVEEECNNSYTYLSYYTHYTKDQYWGKLTSTIELK